MISYIANNHVWHVPVCVRLCIHVFFARDKGSFIKLFTRALLVEVLGMSSETGWEWLCVLEVPQSQCIRNRVWLVIWICYPDLLHFHTFCHIRNKVYRLMHWVKYMNSQTKMLQNSNMYIWYIIWPVLLLLSKMVNYMYVGIWDYDYNRDLLVFWNVVI